MIRSSFITKPITFIVLRELENTAVFTNLCSTPAKVLWHPVWETLIIKALKIDLNCFFHIDLDCDVIDNKFYIFKSILTVIKILNS